MFAIRNLSVLSYAQGFTLWHYRAGADSAPVTTEGFFNDARDMFAQGDMVLVSSPQGGQMLFVTTADQDVRVAEMGAGK